MRYKIICVNCSELFDALDSAIDHLESTHHQMYDMMTFKRFDRKLAISMKAMEDE